MQDGILHAQTRCCTMFLIEIARPNGTPGDFRIQRALGFEPCRLRGFWARDFYLTKSFGAKIKEFTVGIDFLRFALLHVAAFCDQPPKSVTSKTDELRWYTSRRGRNLW